MHPFITDPGFTLVSTIMRKTACKDVTSLNRIAMCGSKLRTGWLIQKNGYTDVWQKRISIMTQQQALPRRYNQELYISSRHHSSQYTRRKNEQGTHLRTFAMTFPAASLSAPVSVVDMNFCRKPGSLRSPGFSPFNRLSNLPILAVNTPARYEAFCTITG